MFFLFTRKLYLKGEEYSPKMFLPLTRKLYLKWTKFLCNFIAWVRIETICIETALYLNDRCLVAV